MPWVYDPDKAHVVSAKWMDKEGLADNDMELANGKTGKALVLTKLVGKPSPAAAGASLQGVAWTSFQELGFDLRNDGHQSRFNPRFSVRTTDGLYQCGPESASQKTFTDAQGRAWARLRFIPDGCRADSSDVMPLDAVILSIDLVFDEGPDQGPGSGTAIVDNITVNGTVIQKE